LSLSRLFGDFGRIASTSLAELKDNSASWREQLLNRLRDTDRHEITTRESGEMFKLTLAFLLLISAASYKPATLRDALQTELQSIGQELQSIFDVNTIFPGLFPMYHG
jgi:hypothetical protein